MVVTVVGAGMMGTATCTPLADRGHEVRLVGTPLDREHVEAVRRDGMHPRLGAEVPRGVRALQVEDLAEALSTSDAVVLGVSSPGVEWAAGALAKTLPRRLPVAMVTKGLELRDGRLAILPDVLRDALPPALRVEPVAIGGPCIAGELAFRRSSAVVYAGRDGATVRDLAKAFAAPYLRIEPCDDPVGVCVCSALKNAYATAVGIGAGLLERAGGTAGPVAMHNLEAAVFTRALREMESLVRALGGRPETVASLAGAGDLFVTTQGGRSSRLGRLLGLGRSLAEARVEMGNPTLEGVDAARTIHEALPALATAGASAEDLRLIRHLHAVLFDGAGAELLFERA